MNVVFYAILIFTAFGGFLLAFYIRHKKRTHETLVCPLNSSCDAVIYSEYSKFLGIPVEIIGLLYYGLIAAGYTLFLAIPALALPSAVFGALALTTAAFMFSLYLTFIQAFAIRQWCTWCLISAGLCTIIFATVLLTSEFGFMALLAEHHEFIALLHLFGAALGIGGATISDVLFFKFLKDFRISEWEAEVLHVLSQVIWFALAVLLLAGLALYLPEAEELNQSAKFLMKMIIVAVIIVNGALLNILIAPKLVKISFGKRHEHEVGELHHIRKIAFALGAISIVSWYSAFILGAIRGVLFEFSTLLLSYLLLIGAAVAASQIMERYFTRQADS